jgi:FkbM family methyltransferase
LLTYWYRRWKQTQRRYTADLSRGFLEVNFGDGPCTILDVGAHDGYFASKFVLRAPLAEVHCFEPNPEVVPKLTAVAARLGQSTPGRPRCVVNPVGVGSEERTLNLNVTGLEQASSFLMPNQAAVAGWPEHDFSVRATHAVQVIRLDRYLEQHQLRHIKLLKIDVQGYELDVLKGLGQRLHDVEYIHVEVQFQRLYEQAPIWSELIGYLRPFGLEPVLMDRIVFGANNEPMEADLLLQRTPPRL